MNKLDIELFRYGNLVFGSVIHQDKSITNQHNESDEDNEDKDEDIGVLVIQDSDFSIVSLSEPLLRDNTLYIRGTCSSEDKTPFFFNYSTEEKAINVCEQIKNLINELNYKGLSNKLEVERIL